MKGPEFRNLKKKLKSTAGESLIEVLVSLLIAGLAILMLGQIVGVSVRMIRRSNETMTEYYSANNVLSVMAPVGGSSSVARGRASVSVTWAGSGVEVNLGVNPDVEYYANQSIGGSEVVSYSLIE